MIKLKHLLPECNECGRDWNHGHDHEAGMAKNELRDMISNASKIDQMVDEGDDLPGWVSAYISLAADYMHSVSEYLAGESSRMQEPGPGYAENNIMAEDKEKSTGKIITTVNDITAHDSSTGEKLTIPTGSKVKVLVKRFPNEPKVMQLSYGKKKVNVNADPFINQYLHGK